ncbi:MAG: alkaline phosphatase family protein [Clostridiales bacterium]|nr:alkaline phosphatase family protein [Clostridiales bacterium]
MKKVVSVLMAVVIAGTLSACANPMYFSRLDSSGLFENDTGSRIPITQVESIVKAHFSEPLPEGKTVKKALIVGFDGGRADGVVQVQDDESSGLAELGSTGYLYLGYVGGEDGTETEQVLYTAPGWASMLTGVWANEHEVPGNYVMKNDQYPTFITALAENGLISSGAFLASWDGHFVSKPDQQGSYVNEMKYIEAQGLAVRFEDYEDDGGTHAAMRAAIQDAHGEDLVFGIYEAADDAGHSEKFASDAYWEGFRQVDAYAYELLQDVKGRAAYEAEDWLILFTSDHGGWRDDHWNRYPEVSTIFIACNKEITLPT